MNLVNIAVPVTHIHETHIYDAPRRIGVGGRYAVNFSPIYAISIHHELDLQGGPEIRLKLLELYVHSAGGLAGRPWWKCHFELPFF